MRKKNETREERIYRYSKLSKKDLVIMLVNTQFVLEVLTSKTPKKTWNKYIKENTRN